MKGIHFPHIECLTSASGMEIVPKRQEGGLVVDGALCVCDYEIKTYKAVGQPLIHHNWRCEYCGSLVPYEKYKCDNCGAPRLEGDD